MCGSDEAWYDCRGRPAAVGGRGQALAGRGRGIAPMEDEYEDADWDRGYGQGPGYTRKRDRHEAPLDRHSRRRRHVPFLHILFCAYGQQLTAWCCMGEKFLCAFLLRAPIVVLYMAVHFKLARQMVQARTADGREVTMDAF